MIPRRDFITLLGGSAAWPLAARSQQGERVRRIGVLMSLAADDPESVDRVTALAQGLAELGWRVRGNVQIEYRWAVGIPNFIVGTPENWSISRRMSSSPRAGTRYIR